MDRQHIPVLPLILALAVTLSGQQTVDLQQMTNRLAASITVHTIAQNPNPLPLTSFMPPLTGSLRRLDWIELLVEIGQWKP